LTDHECLNNTCTHTAFFSLDCFSYLRKCKFYGCCFFFLNLNFWIWSHQIYSSISRLLPFRHPDYHVIIKTHSSQKVHVWFPWFPVAIPIPTICSAVGWDSSCPVWLLTGTVDSFFKGSSHYWLTNFHLSVLEPYRM
jgi:hypothetical protein